MMMRTIIKNGHLFYHNISSTANRAKVTKLHKREIRPETTFLSYQLSYHIGISSRQHISLFARETPIYRHCYLNFTFHYIWKVLLGNKKLELEKQKQICETAETKWKQMHRWERGEDATLTSLTHGCDVIITHTHNHQKHHFHRPHQPKRKTTLAPNQHYRN